MIYCIIGKSATGKDSVYKEVLNRMPELKKICIYTTRPKRDYEVDGIEYHFVDFDYLEKNNNKIIEMRVYNTVYGKWFYATLNDGNIKIDEDYIIIGTLESYKKLNEFFGNENVFPIFLDLPADIIRQRAMERELKQNIPKIEEMERRLKADEIDFSEENIKNANIKKKYVNIDFDTCVNEIIDDIIKNRKC